MTARGTVCRGFSDGLALPGWRGHVTYSRAMLAHATAHRIDLDRIWRDQSLTPRLDAAIVAISHAVYRVLTDPPGGANVTEWAKREACWERVRDLAPPAEVDLEAELISLNATRRTRTTGIDAPDEAEREVMAAMAAVPADTWFELSHWAKETGNLQVWQRKIAFAMGVRVRQGREPSRKQAVQAEKILEEARRLGYRGGAGFRSGTDTQDSE